MGRSASASPASGCLPKVSPSPRRGFPSPRTNLAEPADGLSEFEDELDGLGAYNRRVDPITEVALLAACQRRFSSCRGIEDLRRLSGGASQETWTFDLTFDLTSDLATTDGPLPCIVRRSPGGGRGSSAITAEVEAEVQRVVREHGVPVAEVRFVLDPDDRLGSGYIMERVAGETLAPRILREAAYAPARAVMARQCGEILARIHGVEPGSLPELPQLAGPSQLEHYRSAYASFDDPRPIFGLAFATLEGRIPEAGQLSLVHGDFRHGNWIVGPEGIRAVLDWELCHLGDPAEDLAWVCVNSWRFGVTEKPVGGFGERSDLFEGYREVAGRPVDEERVRAWEIFGTLKWGIMCMIQGFAHLEGRVRSVEKAAIGRRVSETEADLARLLAELV